MHAEVKKMKKIVLALIGLFFIQSDGFGQQITPHYGKIELGMAVKQVYEIIESDYPDDRNVWGNNKNGSISIRVYRDDAAEVRLDFTHTKKLFRISIMFKKIYRDLESNIKRIIVKEHGQMTSAKSCHNFISYEWDLDKYFILLVHTNSELIFLNLIDKSLKQ